MYAPGPPPGPPRAAPIYVYEPLAAPPLRPRAPVNALWFGARGGVLFPTGTAYEGDTQLVDALGYPVVASQRWSELAGAGPSLEINVGGRFSRNYILYGLWERAWLAGGEDPTGASGKGHDASSDFAGIGFRWSSNPNAVGIVADLALGYRWFRESWEGGTSLDLQGFGETRLGIGADIRVTDAFSLSPLFAISLGSFTERTLNAGGGSAQYRYAGAHDTITLTLGGHFDWAP